MPKSQRRSKRRSKRLARLDATWQRLRPRLISPQARAIALSALAAVTVALLMGFALSGRLTALYVLALTAGALGLLMVSLPRLMVGLTAAWLYVQPLLIYLPHTEYSYTKAIASVWAISALGLIWVGRLALTPRRHVRLTALIWPTLGVLGAALLSLANSAELMADFPYVILVACFAVLGLIVANHVHEERSVRLLIGSLLASGSLAALYGLLQYFGVVEGDPGASQGGTQAIISTFGNRNYLGGFLAYLVAPGLWLLLDGRGSHWLRAGALAAIALVTTTLVAIDSDSAWLAYVLSILAVVGGLVATRNGAVLKRAWRWSGGLVVAAFGLTWLLHVGTQLGLEAGPIWPRSWQDVAPVVGWAGLLTLGLVPLAGLFERLGEAPAKRRLALLAAVAVLVGLGLASPPGRTAISDVGQIATSGSAQIRAQDWWIGWHMFTDHPLVGTGMGDYKREFLTYKAEFLQTPRGRAYQARLGHIRRAAQAHNEYVQILAEMGLVGVVSVGAFLAALAGSVIRRIRSAATPSSATLAVGLAGGVVAFLSDAVFSFPLHLPANALVFVTLVGLLQSPALGESSRQVALSSRGAQVTAAAALVLFMTISFGAYRDSQADIWLDRARRVAAANPARAEPWLQRSIQHDVAPSEALYWLGRAKLAQGDVQAAQRPLTRANRLYQTEDSFYYAADAHFRAGETERAKRYLEQLLAANPERPLRRDARYLYALVRYREGQTDEAVEILQSLLEANYQPIKMRVNLGEIYASTDQPDAAKRHLKRALTSIDRELAELDEATSPRRRELERLRRRAERLLPEQVP